MKKFKMVMAALVLTTALSGCNASDNRQASEAPQTVTEQTGETTVSEKPEENQETADPETETADGMKDNTPAVYMTTDISPEGLQKVYEALGWTPQGNVAVKLHTGEPGSNYLRPELIGELVQSVEGTIVECNTAAGFPTSRVSTALHMQVAEDHGFTAIAEVDIMDSEGEINIPVTGGRHLEEDVVGSHLDNYDSMIVLSHFKGHMMGGFGGAIKNISIGIASSEGKNLIHTAGERRDTFMGNASQEDYLESMAEAASAVIDYVGNENMIFINVMNRLSVDCDCVPNPAEPDMHDIGILASADPIALDQACVDLVYDAPDGDSLIKRIESLNGIHTLDYAAELGVGSQTYHLISVDD